MSANVNLRVKKKNQVTKDEGRRTKDTSYTRSASAGYNRSSFVRLSFFVAVLLLLTACAIEGGVPPSTPIGEVAQAPTPGTTATAGPRPSAASAQTSGAAATSAPTNNTDSTDTLTIGMLAAEQPRSLLPYADDSTDARNSAPVTALLFPPPLLAQNYAYTTTGVLEQVPSLQNGGAQLQTADRYLDAAGNITTTVTEVITKAQQLVVTYHWNPALRWADGTPVTADDSVFAYELAKQTALGQDAASHLALLDRYVALDAHTTQAWLKPDYLDPNYFLTYWTPLPRHLLKDVTPETLKSSAWATRPVGYGPYTFARRDGTTLWLERNRYYPGPAPLAERISIVYLSGVDALRAGLLNGSIDVASADRMPTDQIPFLQQAQQQKLMQVNYVANPMWEHLDFNLDVPLLQDIRVRRAIALGTNRQGMVDAIFGGHGSVLESWIMPGQAAAAPLDQLTRYPYDPAQANTLLDQVGWKDTDGDGVRDSNGAPITMTLLTTTSPTLRTDAATRFKQDMGAIGITVNVQAVSAQELYDPNGPLFQRKFQLALFAWIAGADPAGYALWSCRAVPSAANGWTGDNFPGWCFREADQAISVATTSLDAAARQGAYVRHQQLLTQELPVLPLFQRMSLVLASPHITGLQPDTLAPITWNITTWNRK